MTAPQVFRAADVIARAMRNHSSNPMVLAEALESAQLLQSPETAAEREQLRNDITGACLARWEEEQENARLRLAWKSAQRGRRQLRARLAEYERPADEDPIRYTLTEQAQATEVHPSVTSWQLEVLESGCWWGTGLRTDSREAAEDLLAEHRKAKPAVKWRVVSATTTYTLLAEDPCHPCGCPRRFDRHADGCPTLAEPGETGGVS